jgi:hypothetical protein
LARRIADYGTYLRPPWLRRFVYRFKHRTRRAAEWPDYLRKEYRNAALPGGIHHMNALFELRRVADPAQMGRILSLEYLIRQFGGSIRIEFDQRAKPGRRKCAA